MRGVGGAFNGAAGNMPAKRRPGYISGAITHHSTSVNRPALLVVMAAILVLMSPPVLCGGPFDISVGSEIQAGKEAASWIERNYPISTDPILNAKLEGIGRRLAQAAERKDLQYEFHVIALPEVNAISLPGGYIYCFQGLIQALPSDDALAFVLAHEMVHAAKRHWAKMMKKATALSVLTLGYADVLNVVLVPHYSRESEREADKFGMEIAARSGFDPEGAVEAMTTLRKIAGSGKEGLPIFRSHPGTDARLAYLKESAQKLKAEKPGATSVVVPPTEAPAYELELGALRPAANTYFPLAEGNVWIYRFTDVQGRRLQQKITVAEQVPGQAGVFRVQSRLGDDLTVNYLAATTNSTLTHRAATSRHGRSGDGKAEWEMAYLLPSAEAAPEGFRVGERETVATPFGSFEAVKIEKLGENGSVERTAWFAPGVGLIKETWPDGLTKVIEEFKPGRMAASDNVE